MFDHCLLKKANSLDFRKIILYFVLSIWTHEYRIKVERWHILFWFFRLTICMPFFMRKNILLSNRFFSIFVRCSPLINNFGSKSRTLRQQNSRLFFSSTSLAHVAWTFCAMTSCYCTTRTDLACLVFCYNLKTW